jgi:hypothetical protein
MLSQSATSGLAISGLPTSDANPLSLFGKLKKIGQQLRILQQCNAFCPVFRIGSPHSLTRTRVLLPPPPSLGPRGRHNRLRGRGWGPDTDEGTDTLVLYVYYNHSTVAINSPPPFASASCLSFSAFLCVAGRAQPQESLVLWKSSILSDPNHRINETQKQN